MKTYVSNATTRGHYEQRDQSILFTPENLRPAMTATTTAPTLISVIAPATLPEGYIIDVQVDGQGRAFSVEAPSGGVEEGESFQVAFDGRSSEDVVHKAVSVARPRVSVPVGAWRDGMCDCFSVNCCHPAFWNAWCCPAILVAQVMTRMKLDVLGRPSTQQAPRTFRIVLAIVITVIFLEYVVRRILFDAMVSVSSKEGMEGWAIFFSNFFYLIWFTFFWFTVYLATVTRAYVRNKYAIPNVCCEIICTSNGCGLEDCCVSYWCMCCTASQLARHTMDYRTYRGVFCSDTGVPNNVPSIV